MYRLFRLLFIASICLWLLATSAIAQGSIFGAVTRSGGGVPANGDIIFIGYLDDTDEEIRIESSVGAGYDEGFWFEDFQNFQTESPGNPYDFHFFDRAAIEGTVLSGLIPDNSFQQEDITLGPVTWPVAPTNLSGRFVSATSIELTWHINASATVHVYRRTVPSAGSFFRIDDPTGALSNPGLADTVFLDTSVGSDLTYEYVLVPENASGTLGPHSEVITVSPAQSCCLIRGDVNHSGGLPIDISDLIYLVDYMFVEGDAPPCHEEADINGDGLETIDIADLVYLIDFMFLAGPAPPPCE